MMRYAQEAENMKLLIADDHPLYRDALSGTLTRAFDQVEVFQSQDIQSTEQLLHSEPDMDLLLLDLDMPGSTELFGLIHLRQIFSNLPVAVVSGSINSTIVQQVIGAGAQGFIPKTADGNTIKIAIKSILDGEVWLPEDIIDAESSTHSNSDNLFERISSLTPAQYKILTRLKEGNLNKQIAVDLSISEATVKAHITAIFKKLGINNRSQAVLIAAKINT